MAPTDPILTGYDEQHLVTYLRLLDADSEVRCLIRRMSVENPLWGAPRIHGELLKLGIAVAQ